jgi:hypothetical protein
MYFVLDILFTFMPVEGFYKLFPLPDWFQASIPFAAPDFSHSQMICQFPSISPIRKVGCVDQTSKYLPQDALVNSIQKC